MKIIKIIIAIIILIFLVFISLLGLIWKQQDVIVQEIIENTNKDFRGSVFIQDSHISPFANFPYISIDLEGLEIYEGKTKSDESCILKIKDAYIGFDVIDILKGDFIVKSITLKDGDIRLVQHTDGAFNISRALENEV